MRDLKGNDAHTDSGSHPPKQKNSLSSALNNLTDMADNVRIIAGETLVRELWKIGSNQQDQERKELQDTVERLVKGLSSTQKSTRVGYTAALIQILQTFREVTARDVLRYMDKHLPTNAKEDKQHVVIGRCLGIGALIRAERAKDVAGEIAQKLLSIISRQAFTHVLVCELIKELLNEVGEKRFKTKVWPVFKAALSKGWDNCSPLMLFVLISSAQKAEVDTEFLQEHWDCDAILSKENFPKIVDTIQSSVSTLPQVHPVCIALLEYASSRGMLGTVWEHVVNKRLLQPSNNEKTFVVLEMLRWCTSHLSSVEEVNQVLTEQLKKQMIQALCNSSHVLHSKALGVVEHLVNFARDSKDSKIQIAVLEFLVKPPSSILFDQITKFKAVHQLLTSATPECVLWYADYLKSFLHEKKNESDCVLGQQLSQGYEQLASLLHLPSLSSTPESRTEIVHFLMEMYATRFGGQRASEESGTKKHLQAAILKALVPAKKSKLAEFADLLASLLTQISESSADWWKSGARKHLRQSLGIMKKMGKEEKSGEKISTSLRALLGYLTILMFLDICKDETILQDVQDAARTCLKGSQDQSSEEKAPCVESIMETLLNMLAMPSQAVRSVTAAVFSFVHKYMTDDALQLLLNVFGAKKEEDDEEDTLMVDEDDDADSSESSGSEMEEEVAEPDEELKRRLREVLGDAAADDEDSESEVAITDEHMFELDDAISAAFKNRLGLSKEEKSNNAHFQIKCLELLQEYVESHPPINHLVKIVDVLVAASAMPDIRNQRAVMNSIGYTLNMISAVRKFSDISDIRDDIKELTKKVVDQASKVSNVNLKTALGNVCPFLIHCHKKIHAHLEPENEENHWYLPLYMDSLTSYLEQGCHISPQLFVKLMEAFPEHCYDFIMSLEEKASKYMEQMHMRLQILGLLVAAIRLLQLESVPKGTELKKTFQKLTDMAVKALKDMADNKEVKTNMSLELADLLAVISKQSQAAGLEHPFRDRKELASALEVLKNLLSPKQKPLKRKVAAILKEIQGDSTAAVEKPRKLKKRRRQQSTGDDLPEKCTKAE